MTPIVANKCPVCDLAGAESYVEKSYGGITSTWYRCKADGTLFMLNFPTSGELTEYYGKNYKHRESPGAVSHLFRFSEENKRAVFSEYELSLSDVGITDAMLRNRRILDYGCANGFFLDYCCAKGCNKDDLYGFDIAEDLLETVRVKQYRILRNERADFDFLFLWDVLEHVPEPQSLLPQLKSHLRPGGLVVLQTPRVGLLANALMESWEHFLPLEHVILYTRESLLALFGKFGFVPIKSTSFGGNAPGT